MPKIPRFALRCILLTAVLLLQFSCGKEPQPPTVITGRVTDKKTGVPIWGANLFCEGYKGSTDHEYFRDFSTKSDTLGYYKIVAANEYRVTFASAFKPNYLTKIDPAGPTPLSLGDSNFIDIALIPLDGFLRLRVQKTGNQMDSIFINLSNSTMVSEGLGTVSIKKYPLILDDGADYSEMLPFPSEEVISVYWGFKPFILPDAPYKNTIYLPSSDTTDFLIEY